MKVIIFSTVLLIVLVNFGEGDAIPFARKNGGGDGGDDDKGEPVQTLPAEIDIGDISLSDSPFDPEFSKLVINTEQLTRIDSDGNSESEVTDDDMDDHGDDDEEGETPNWEDYYDSYTEDTPIDEIENSENESEIETDGQFEDYENNDHDGDWESSVEESVKRNLI